MNFKPSNEPLRWDAPPTDPSEDIERGMGITQKKPYRRPMTHEEVALQMLTQADLRTCRYCQTFQRKGYPCGHCGAPDEQHEHAHGPLTLAPMRLFLP